MKPISQITACVVDNGLFLPLAHRLAKDYKRVLYHTHCDQGFPTVGECSIGKGFPDIERCDDIWEVKKEVDLWIFPDIQYSGLQLELESQGEIVWGSRAGDDLEIKREYFHKVLGKVGLEVPEFEVVEGITKLREYLANKENVFVKISRYRGSLETKKFRNMDLDGVLLDVWAMRFGPVGEQIRFMVFTEIPTDLEIGGDTYNIDGQFPSKIVSGIEGKDVSYFGTVMEREEMPEQIQEILEAFGPILKKYRYRNQISFEDRVAGDKHYFIDITCRGPMPASGSQYRLYKNLPEIIYAGAQGELIEPEIEDKCSAEVLLTIKPEDGCWGKVILPESLAENVDFFNCCMVDGAHCFPPDEDHARERAGWLVTTGKNMRDTLENLMDLAKELPDGLKADTDALVELINEAESAKQEDIPVTSGEIPEPEIVLA